MTTQYLISKNINGFNGFGILFCDLAYTVTLSSSSDTAVNVPASGFIGGINASVHNRWVAMFSYTSGKDVFVALNSTAAAPAGSSFELSTSELNPSAKTVQTGDVIHMFTTESNVNVSVAFYAIQE